MYAQNDFMKSTVLHTYRDTQADNLINNARNVLPTEEYNRMIKILEFSTSNKVRASVGEYMILDILSKHSLQLKEEFEFFFACSKDTVNYFHNAQKLPSAETNPF
tara:strand:+ start:2147 stop:2461 length:315 start_codon:yes stop_codon:yes gene_type:complete